MTSVRGPQGGYKLSKPASAYKVSEILKITEGSLSPVACLETENNTCEKKDTCQKLALWEGLKKVINSYLDNVTLEDLANKTESDDCYMYNI